MEDEKLSTLKLNLEQFEAQKIQLIGGCGCHQHTSDEKQIAEWDKKIEIVKAEIERLESKN